MKNKDRVLWILPAGLRGSFRKEEDWLGIPAGNLSPFSISRTAEVSLRVKDHHPLTPESEWGGLGHSNWHLSNPPIG